MSESESVVHGAQEAVVVNTSPWIALSLCSQTRLLESLYREVYIPKTVREEILTGGATG